MGLWPSFSLMVRYRQEKPVLVFYFLEFLKPENGAKIRKNQGKWENGATWPISLDIKLVNLVECWDYRGIISSDGSKTVKMAREGSYLGMWKNFFVGQFFCSHARLDVVSL